MRNQNKKTNKTKQFIDEVKTLCSYSFKLSSLLYFFEKKEIKRRNNKRGGKKKIKKKKKKTINNKQIKTIQNKYNVQSISIMFMSSSFHSFPLFACLFFSHCLCFRKGGKKRQPNAGGEGKKNAHDIYIHQQSKRKKNS